LRYEKQLEDKHMALWLDLQKKHKAIAARKPRGTYRTTQSDYWLDVFLEVFPDVPDDERAARLQAMEALEDGLGWNVKWRSFATVKAYKPDEAEIDAKVWRPVFLNLSRHFEVLNLKLAELPMTTQQARQFTSQPTMDASPQSTTADVVVEKQKYTFADFAVPTFDFSSNKQVSFERSLPLTTEEKATAPPTSVLQQPLPVFSPPSLFSNIGTAITKSPADDWSIKYDKSLPFGLHKPRESPEMWFGKKGGNMFIFDDLVFSDTFFGGAATAAEPFRFAAGSDSLELPDVELLLKEEFNEPCVEIPEKIADVQDAKDDGDSIASFEASLPGTSPMVVTLVPTASALGDDALKDITAMDPSPQYEVEEAPPIQHEAEETAIPQDSLASIIADRVSYDDEMYGALTGYELFAQRDYDSSETESESESSVNTRATSPEHAMDLEDGKYVTYDVIDNEIRQLQHNLPVIVLEEIKETNAPHVEICSLPFPVATISEHPFGEPGQLPFELEFEDDADDQDGVSVDYIAPPKCDHGEYVESAASITASMCTDGELGHATILDQYAIAVPAIHPLETGLEPIENIRDWAE
jgi:hypothetical protein